MAVSNVYRKGDMLINGKPVEQVDNIKYLGTTIEQAGNIEVLINGKPVEQVDNIKYLGTTIEQAGNIEVETNKRITAAKVLNYPLQYQPIQFLRIWYSKSKNAIKITSAEQNTVDCESKLEFTVLYNSRRFKKCQEVEFNYILTSRGAILNTGSVLRKPRKTVLNLDNYKNVIGKEKYDAGPILVDQFDLSLQLDKQVYTSAKLLVYYEYDDEVISDAIDINIKACTTNQQKIFRVYVAILVQKST
ncbi:Alpha-2-macroglobulin bait region domain [Popillia japonica]|uniref:Alpha-2-macroglobulin bait region domain n=1 Tax=Popillia japonica TaxID=7064 RepID=A0AAW1KRJ4_POPJA